MNEKLNKIIVCPKCHSKLKIDHKIKCKKCKLIFNFKNGIPFMILKKPVSTKLAKYSYRERFLHLRSYKLFSRAHKILGSPDNAFERKEKLYGKKIEKNLAGFLRKYMTKDTLILDLGSGAGRIHPDAINLDIDSFNNIDVVGSGESLPFKNSSFDLIILQSVLEHVNEPEKVIMEAERVLKRGGKIYVSVPFVFVYHGSPEDNQRYTLDGLRNSFKNFKETKSGVISGPSSTFNQILRYYLALLFSFNNDFLFSFFLNIFGWLTFPLKYLDIFLNKYKKAHLIANIIYFIGEKK